jgi:carbonic anhydrase/acetyltransferase-like protein (isoleucine patch superfamily)
MILEHRGRRPVVPASAYVAPSAVLCGAVVLGERARVLHGAVLTAEDGAVRVGDDVVVMENALVRGRSGHPAVLGDAVLVGPHAHVNGATIEDEVFLATGVAVFPGAVAGAGSELRIHSVLHVGSRLAPGTVVPIGWIAAGDPAQLFAPERHEELWEVQRELDFPGTVYGVARGTSMRTIMARQVEFYGAHRADREVDGLT